MASDALVTKGLSRRFGMRQALDEVTITVPEASIYGFLGPNGAGKTTLIRCVLGLLASDGGHVSIFGEADPVARRRGVGAIVETPSFHPFLSGRDNLVLAAAYAGISASDPVDVALDQVGMGARADDAVGEYSMGMRQRLGLARAILGRPRLLVLDEPTNGLDPRGMKDVRDLLGNLARGGMTVFLSSHLLAEVQQLCTHVGIVEQGRLVSEGTMVDDLEAHFLSVTGSEVT